ncbi:MAG: hypothetical protein ACE37F_14215 [Nannocystaceae bacterium]|nr:hypothetical protein [bacterium]
MPLSTPAKIGLGILAGGTAAAGLVAGVAHARKKKSMGMKRDGGSAPGDQPVVELDLAQISLDMLDAGYPIDVGTQYEIVLPLDVAAEFDAGRRFGQVTAAKIVDGEPSLTKTWKIEEDSFRVDHNGFSVGFDLERKRLLASADRAGFYAFAMRDRDGTEILDDLAFFATRPTDGVMRLQSAEAFFRILDQSPDGTFAATVGERIRMPKASPVLRMHDVQTVSIAKVVNGIVLDADEWSVHRGKLPKGFSVGTDLEVEFVDESDTINITANRAGVYELTLLDVDGIPVRAEYGVYNRDSDAPIRIRAT